ncbi:ATP-binding cassette domain-containing protein [Metamycoplasma hominis]|uniref:Mbov_0121 family peptidase domain-containing ABC transporter n=1 Tax=Metamycoplasma hominis TaxID=2098 RepID=UPI001593CB9D|nr:cysteine peptidase family C39 domain-containing protein [Metamycoplasma hominis]MBD3898824.1 ATP-binding cassette domain-containing protein [Metamycoplasma hominis]QKX37387.1 ATP-binding cassette domain-containing protein [Metamycoplasma hominis]
MWINKQDSVKDCAIYTLQAMICHFFKYKADINFLKKNTIYDEEGVSLYSFKKISDFVGFDTNIYKVDFLSFISNLNDISFPFVTILKNDNFLHYTIVKRIDKAFVYLCDSEFLNYRLEINEFKNKFINVVVILSKKFKTPNCTKINYNLYLTQNTKLTLISIFLAILFNALMLSSSFYIKYVLSVLWSENANNRLLSILIIFSWIAILKAITWLFKKIIINKLTFYYEKKLYLLVKERLKFASQKDLQKINQNDFMARILSISTIAEYKAGLFLFLFENIIIFISSTLLLGLFNYRILLICLLGISITFAISLFSLKYQSKKATELINLKIKSIKMFNNYFLNYEYRTNDLNNSNSKLFQSLFNTQYNLGIFNETKDSFITFIWDFIQLTIVFTGAWLFIKNKDNFTNITLYGSISIFLNSPIVNLVFLISNSSINRQGIIRIKYLLEITQNNDGNISFKPQKQNKINILNTSINIGSKNVIKNLNLTIKNNLEISGKNGVGKSLILNAIFKVYWLNQGHIFVNNINLKHISQKSWLDACFLNKNNEYFCYENLMDCICKKDNIKENIFLKNFKKYNLNNLFLDMNLPLNKYIENGGNNLSSGQKEFIIIMRLFCQKYYFILLDEAFENITNEIFLKLKFLILNYQDRAIFIEISHNKKIVANKRKIFALKK